MTTIADGSVTESKLSADVKNKLNAGGGGSSAKYKVRYPANFGVGYQKKGVATSDGYYNLNNMPIINLVCKWLSIGNIFANSQNILALTSDSGSLKFGLFSGYDLRLQLSINGTVLREVKYGQSDDIWTALVNSHSWVLTFDYVTKRFLVKTKATITTWSMSFVIDISDWELDQLGDFKISTEIGALYAPKLGSKYFLFNTYADNDYYLGTKLLADNYSPFAVKNVGTLVNTTDLIVKVDGTLVETITPTHVVKSYNKETRGYFAMGCSATGDYNIGSVFATKVRFNEITADTGITSGVGYSNISIYDEELNIINAKLGSTQFVPEVGKWYIFVVTMSREISYTSLYAFKLIGAGTVEVEALYVANPQNAAIGSLNWDGEYFTGHIPFKGEGVEFEKITDPSVPPLYTLKEDNGKISMWNGTTWKQISNA